MNLQELKAKTKEFVKKHKKAIIVTATVAGSIVMFAITKKTFKKMKPKLTEVGLEDACAGWEQAVKDNIVRFAPDWNVGELTCVDELVSKNGTELEFIVNDLTPADLGKVGENLLSCVNVTDGSKVSTLMYVMTQP